MRSILTKIQRILFIPLSIFPFICHGILNCSRDMQNRYRFSKSKIGRGCVFNDTVRLFDPVKVGHDTVLLNTEVGKYTYIQENCVIQNAKIGNYCSIASDVKIGLGRHPTDDFSTSPIFYSNRNLFGIKHPMQTNSFLEFEPIEIGHDVWIGMNAIIRDGVKIGTGAVIAAGAIVTHDVPDYAIVGGSPARIIKYRFPKERQEKLLETDWFLKEPNEISENIRGVK